MRLLVCAVFFSLTLAAQVTISGLSTVEIQHPDNTGVTSLILINQGKEAVSPKITASGFVSTATHRSVAGTVAFDGLDTALAPGEHRRISAKLSGFSDAAEAEARLLVDGNEAATLRAAKYAVPFAVSVDGKPTDQPALSFTANCPLRVTLKNADPMNYHVIARLHMDGAADEVQRAVVPGSGAAFLDFQAASIQPNWLTYLPRLVWWSVGGGTRPAVLTLHYAPSGDMSEDATLPMRVVSMNLSPVFAGDNGRLLWSGTCIFVVLLLGGLLSLGLNMGLPNASMRAQLNDRLNLIGRDVGDLSFALVSRARVSAAVARKRLKGVLRSQIVFSPECTAVLKPLGDSVTLLETRIALLRALDVACAELHRLISLRLPPTLIQQASSQLDECMRILSSAQPTPAELQIASAQTGAAIALVEKLSKSGPGQADADFVRALLGRVQDVQAHFVRPFGARLSQYEADLPALFEILNCDTSDASKLTPDDYFELDSGVERLRLIRREVQTYEGRTSPFLRSKLDTIRGEFVNYLGESSWGGLQAAAMLVREAEEGIDRDEIIAAIKNGQFAVNWNRALVRANDQVGLCVCFCTDSLNFATARNEFQCRWTFTPPPPRPDDPRPEQELHEQGWTVDHYFAGAGTYNVSVTFKDWFGNTVQHTKPPEPLNVMVMETGRIGARTKLELIRLLFALLIVLLALMGGARDQLAKLGPLAGLVAVFAIGFGADTVKNLFAPKAS